VTASRVERKVVQIKTHLQLRREIQDEITGLAPWYQPINFGYGLWTVAVDKAGHRYTSRSLDRGIAKWNTFIKPNLPFDLAGKRVLELGCNAGLFLVECVRAGAREAAGIEKGDHYYRQARFVTRTFSRLRGRYYPVRVFRGAMEDFDYESLGKFDLALLLNVIYHIGKSADYSHLSNDEIAALQIETLHRVSGVARYLLFQANPLEDEGRGKGKDSLLELVHRAGLMIVKETVYDHPRGYILLTRSEKYQDRETFPIKRMISKYFLPAHLNAEREVVDLHTRYGRDGFDITQTRYYRLRTAQIDWRAPGVAHLPASLDREPIYWVMPWCYKRRERNQRNTLARIKAFPQVYARFLDLIDSILDGGFDPARSIIPGYRLVHPDYGDVFIYVDGNQRMGVLSYLAERLPDGNLEVPVEIRQVVERERLLGYPLTRQLIEEGYFTEGDALRWFDNAFGHLPGFVKDDDCKRHAD